MKFNKILLLIALVVSVTSTQLRPKSQKVLQQKQQEQPPKLFHIPLQKSVLSIDEKGQQLNFVKLKQKYMLGDIDLDYDDFEQQEYKSTASTSGIFDFEDSNGYNYQKAASDAGNQARESAKNKNGFKNISLRNFKNTQYTGSFALGDENNTFNVIYDTGSANTWINSVKCHDKGCKNHKQYDGSQSATYKSIGLSLDVEFGTGGLSGEINEDTAYFGGIEIPKQSFAEIVKEEGDVFAQSGFAGIVGFAFKSMAAYDENPVFDNVIEQNKLENNVFSFYLSQNEGKSDSKITLGGVDTSLYTGDLKYHKVIDEYYWLLKADNILIGGQDVGLCSGGCNVIADTGTSLLTGPSDDLYDLLNKISVDDNCHNVSELPDITFILDGTHYTLGPEEYVMSVTQDGVMEDYENMSSSQRNNSECAAAFMPLDIPDPQGPAWILGDVFLAKYFSVYDRDSSQVGFALAKHSQDY